MVAKKINSADFAVLKTFLADAIAAITSTSGTSVAVSVDSADVLRAYGSAGTERAVSATDAVLANYSYLKSDAVGAVAKVEEIYITSLGTTSTDNKFTVNGSAVSVIPGTGLDTYYDVASWAAAAGTAAQLSAAGVEIVSYGKGQRTASIEFNTPSTVTTVFTVDAGPGSAVSVTYDNSAGSTVDGMIEDLRALLAASDASVSKIWTVASSTGKLTFNSNAKGSARTSFDLSVTGYQPNGTSTASTVSQGTASLVLTGNTDATTAAWVRVKSVTEGIANAKTITLTTNAAAELLTASGIETSVSGDDEYYVAASNGTGQSTSNVNAIKDVSVNNVQYIQ